MKIWKSIILFVSVTVMLLSIMTVSADKTESDPTGDVAHWEYTTGKWGWNLNIENKPDIDITELKQSLQDGKMTLEIVVAGTIQTAELYAYSAWFNTSDAYYMFYWTNGEGGGLAMNTMGGFNVSQADVQVNGNTISATFDVIGEDTTAETFWGYAWQYTNMADYETAEWWGDWAPETHAPFSGDNVDDDDSGDGDNVGDDDDDDVGDDDDDGDGGSSGSSETPGFETIAVLAAVGLTLIILKRRK